jgi:glycosyltransferase involved in cell wall biosynthesis
VTMNSILIIQRALPAYRLAFFKGLAKSFNVHVVHSGRHIEGEIGFQQTIIPQTIIAGFRWQHALRQFTRSVDVVVIDSDPHFLSNIALMLKRRRYKLIAWGHGLGRSNFMLPLRKHLMNRCDAMIVYDPGIRAELAQQIKVPLFCAPNTVYVCEPLFKESFQNRTHFLFVGQLALFKKVDCLIRAIATIKPNLPSDIHLDIIGTGPAYKDLEELAATLHIPTTFHGEITDEVELRRLFHTCRAYVSPGAVGLGVLHSFAFGVPVITARHEPHGPEIRNIIDEQTGLFYDGSLSGLAATINRCIQNPELCRRLGKNAYDHYCNHRRMEQMVDGFSSCLYDLLPSTPGKNILFQ